MKNDKGIEILMEISEKKESALKKILQCTMAQELLIKQGDLEKLSDIIHTKQRVIEKVNGMDIDFLTYYKKLKRDLGVESMEDIDVRKYPSLKELKIKISNIMMLLKRIEDVDLKNTTVLKEEFTEIKQKMKALKEKKQVKKASSAYARKYADYQGIFIDHK